MMAYVLFGGMIATTWVQIIKACLLLGGAVVMTVLVLAQFGFNPIALFAKAAELNGAQVLEPGTKVVTGAWDAVSLGLALMFGTAGLPHIRCASTRFPTPSRRASRCYGQRSG
jgi:cation/acetate symporter